jgi:enoyl-CoA hydratase/carnithine racemase
MTTSITSNAIRVERRGQVVTITLDRPEVLNALDLAALDALDRAWSDFDRDPELRVAILTGSGERSFSTGADLKRFAPPGASVELQHAAFFPKTNKPIVAAVNGYCIAGGLELLGATDLRVAAEHATFALTEAKLGLFPAGGSAVRFPHQLPWPLAMELMIGGREISAEEALRWGLVNRVVPLGLLMDTAQQIAERIAKLAPISVQAIKESARSALGMTLEEGYRAQIELTRRVVSSEDAEEGRRAFLEKREPRFRGR